MEKQARIEIQWIHAGSSKKGPAGKLLGGSSYPDAYTIFQWLKPRLPSGKPT